MQNFSFQSISDSTIPIAITDLSLTLQYGNQSLYALIGNELFYSIYKVVIPTDRSRLNECVQNITASKTAADVFSILYNDNEFYYMLLHFTYIKNNRLIKIEFQYLSDILKEQTRLEYELMKYRTLFSLEGDHIFEYESNTNRFKLYWVNGKQNILRFYGDLNVWMQNAIQCNAIAIEDKPVFLEFCHSVVNTAKSFEYQISTNILANGEIFESTKIKALTLKRDSEQKIVVGVWFPFNLICNRKENHFIDSLYKDELTGLLNKREITQYVHNHLLHQQNDRFYLLILDLDNFKQCNDVFGHMFGDEILKLVASILKNTIQEHGVAGRMGGDEFLIVLENIDSDKLLRSMLRSIRSSIQWLYKEKLTTFQLGCSMGVACYPKDATDYNTLFQLADYSLYLAKNKGKSRYIIYDYKLHGLVSANDADLSIRTQNSNGQSSITLSEVQKKTALLYTDRKNAILPLFEALKDYLNLQNISVYIPNLSYGELELLNQNILVYAPILFQADYLEQFQETNCYCVTHIKNIEFTYRSIYQYFTGSTLLSYYQFLLTDAHNNPTGILSFERSCIHYSWNSETKQLLSLISTIIETILFS